MSELLDLAIRIATEAHVGQVDKAGRPYIDHPLRVMRTVEPEGEEAMMVAILHDVVEDTPTTLADLRRMGFSAAVIDGVNAMTRRPGEGYQEYIERCCGDPLGRVVKAADLVDNMDPKRAFAGNHHLMRRYRETVEYMKRLPPLRQITAE
jgi:(p)ppGpp synthase/HD superfamily hydrolase